MDKKITLTVLLISSISLGGCSSVNKKSNFAAQKPRPTIATIMKRQGGETDVNTYRQSAISRSSIAHSKAPISHYTRSEAKELEGLFPRLPNPDLCMYVYPHLSLEEATIPGYTSCFSLYDKNHYALPGEMPATWQASQ